MRKQLAIAFTNLTILFGASALLSACHTVEGAGKDVSAAGREITEQAKEHK
jgi:predicted small secreted protein